MSLAHLGSKTVGDLTWDDVRSLTPADLVPAFMALQGVLHMKECDLARERVARYRAEYNYAGTMLTQAQEGLKRAEAHNRGE